MNQAKRMWPGPFLEDDVITSIGMLHSIQMLAIVRKLFHCNCSYVIMWTINYTMHVHTYVHIATNVDSLILAS